MTGAAVQARGDVQGEGKEERSLEEWLALIAKEEAAGDGAAEAALLQEFLDWERLSSTAPNGKWRGANSRKWGKVGIEMRLTGNVPCTEGPVTELGQMICKFVDIVEERPAVRVDGISDGPSTSASNDGAERVRLLPGARLRPHAALARAARVLLRAAT